MAFNLKKVIKALLLSSSQPLSIKDIQAAFTRFHDEANQLATEGDEGEEGAAPATPATESAPTPVEAAPVDSGSDSDSAEPEAAPAEAAPAESVSSETPTPIAEAGIPAAAPSPQEAPIEALAPAQQDPELYVDVPSLITGTQIREAMDQIAAELKASDDGVLLIEGSSGFRIVTHPRFGKWVRILRQEPPPAKLTQSAVETLAVIAYRQPVTKGEIETIRGVSAEAGVAKL
ncbi:MAG TPA: SMC-Scp complex subunit ScpB, partial [Opitutaceae bacterium]